MRLAVNALFLDHPGTGTGTYTRNVLEVLPRLAAEHGHRLLALTSSRPHDLPAALSGSLKLATPFDGRAENLAKVWFEQVAVPAAVGQTRADLLYSPYFSLPLAGAERGVVTVHDMIPLLLPEYAPSRPIQAYFRLVMAATRRAAAIITVSNHARSDIVRLLGVPPERIHVAYEGADSRFRPNQDPGVREAVRRRYGLPERFVLYLGGADRRKNVGVLLDALAGMSPAAASGVPPLVVVARSRREYSALFPDLRGQAAARRLGQRVRFVEWVEEEDKPALYACAEALCFPSLYEGFGLTPLEAMACGTPVLCSRATSLPEVVGDGGLLLDPAEPAAWAEALLRVCGDPALRAALRGQGLAQAACFSWESMGARVLAVLESTALRR